MNVFKLLSRSAKAPQSAPSQKLPSAGAVANPQLFGHDKPEKSPQNTKKSRKRKRGQEFSEAAVALPADIDFFRGAPQADEGSKADVGQQRRKRRDNTS